MSDLIKQLFYLFFLIDSHACKQKRHIFKPPDLVVHHQSEQKDRHLSLFAVRCLRSSVFHIFASVDAWRVGLDVESVTKHKTALSSNGQILISDCRSFCLRDWFHFLLPIRAISSALAAAFVLMSWFLARSMRTLRMLVGTSRDRAKRDPCWALFGTWEAGRGGRARLNTRWCSDRSSEFSTPLRFKMSTASTSLWVSSSSWAKAGRLLWLWMHRGSSRARQKQKHTLLMVGTVWKQKQKVSQVSEIFDTFYLFPTCNIKDSNPL